MTAFGEEIKQEIIKEGCFQPNCKQRTWAIEKQTEFGDGNCETGENCLSTFRFFFPQTDVLIRTEIKLYTFLNFFAEVGGYLGLLLGESLISYVDMVWDGIGSLVNYVKHGPLNKILFT